MKQIIADRNKKVDHGWVKNEWLDLKDFLMTL